MKIDGPGSPSLQSPIFQSSPPLAESSQPASIITEKSLADLSSSEKGRWREYEDEPDKFFDNLDLPLPSREWLRRRFHLYAEMEIMDDSNLKNILTSIAVTDLEKIKKFVEQAGKEKSIQWSQLDFSDSSEITDVSCDDLIFCWLEAMKINVLVKVGYTDKYQQLFCCLLPIAVKPMEEPLDVVASAFHRKERPTPDGRLSSQEIYRKIIQYYRAHIQGKYLAPYTSVVGPSGIGKSFTISQMAHGYGMYVVYSNFAERGMSRYPERSAIADILPYEGTRAAKACFWESYLMVAMCDVELCRHVGVSPGGFYYLQTMKAYRNYQEDFSNRVSGFFQNYRGNYVQGPYEKRRAKLADLLRANVEAFEERLKLWRECLEKRNHNPKVRAVTGKDVPNALICLDEVHMLLDGEESLLFQSFRDAIRRRFVRTNRMENLDLTKPQGDFFALILDTNCKVADFALPLARKYGHERNWNALFPPLFAIDNVKVFAQYSQKRHPDGSEEATIDLFHYGRPLWGGLINSGESLFNVMQLARQKLEGRGPSYLIALLSYRLSFYIANNAIAEDLVSGWMRYILYINQGRDMLLTSQPSEPILAHTSATLMSDPVTRYQILQHFTRISFEGSIRTGDLGEIVAAILLFFTYDEVYHNEEHNLPTAVSFKGFLASLLGSQVADSIIECSSTDAEMSPICSNGQVFCNHFFKQERYPTKKTLEDAFLRGAGIILPDNFPGAGLLIPIKLPGGGMTFFGIQVKNRVDDSYSGFLKDETIRSFSKAAKTLNSDMPFIRLIMALRRDKHASEGQSVGIVDPPKPTGHDARSGSAATSSAEYKWPKKNKRILVLAVGLEESVYPGITSCRGEKSQESEAILPLLKRLLDCKPGVTLPDDADLVYANRVKSLEV